MLMQSSVRQAGTSPAVLSSPGVGLIPTILLNAAGTLPDPDVSVPSAKEARPAPTATADPDPAPTENKSPSNTQRVATTEQHVHMRPVAHKTALGCDDKHT